MDILLVIDLQKQFKDDEGQYEKCLQYIKDNKDKYYVIGTLFVNAPGSMYEKHLGWKGCQSTNYTDIEYPYNELVVKTGYQAQIEQIVENARKVAQKEDGKYMPDLRFDVIGCDADACILATAFSLWDRGDNFRILSNYIYTTATDFSKEDILKIMERNFGNCVV